MSVLNSKDQDRRDAAPVEAAVRSGGWGIRERPKQQSIRAIEIYGENAGEVADELMASGSREFRDVGERRSRVELVQSPTN